MIRHIHCYVLQAVLVLYVSCAGAVELGAQLVLVVSDDMGNDLSCASATVVRIRDGLEIVRAPVADGLFADLEVGSYWAYVEAPGYRRITVENITIISGALTEEAVVLRAAIPGLVGVVRSLEAGAPLPGVIVYAVQGNVLIDDTESCPISGGVYGFDSLLDSVGVTKLFYEKESFQFFEKEVFFDYSQSLVVDVDLADAQAPSFLEVRVVDSMERTPVPDAILRVSLSGRTPTAEIGDGVYLFDALEPGVFELKVSADNYFPKSRLVEIFDGVSRSLIVELALDDGQGKEGSSCSAGGSSRAPRFPWSDLAMFVLLALAVSGRRRMALIESSSRPM